MKIQTKLFVISISLYVMMCLISIFFIRPEFDIALDDDYIETDLALYNIKIARYYFLTLPLAVLIFLFLFYVTQRISMGHKNRIYIKELENNEKKYKDNYYFSEKCTKRLACSLLDNMQMYSSIKIVDRYNNIYSITKAMCRTINGNFVNFSIQQLYKQSEKSFLDNKTDYNNKKFLCESFADGDVQLVTNDNKTPIYNEYLIDLDL